MIDQHAFVVLTQTIELLRSLFCVDYDQAAVDTTGFRYCKRGDLFVCTPPWLPAVYDLDPFQLIEQSFHIRHELVCLRDMNRALISIDMIEQGLGGSTKDNSASALLNKKIK